MLMLLFYLVGWSAPLTAASEPVELKVGLREAAPFTMQIGDGEWNGLAVDLWERIAEKNNYSFEYETYLLADLLEALESGEIDAAVAPLTITAEREKIFDFTLPFMQSGLAIAAEVKPTGWWHSLRRIVSLPFLQAAGALALVIAVFGLLMWLFERRKNEMFSGTTVEGLGSGFWWSAVTMTTVGYGDKAPVTLGGRIVGLVWMFAAIIIISGFTAAIASSLTVGSLDSGIEELDDLRSRSVGVIESSSAAAFLDEERVRYRRFENLDAMLDALEAGRVAAVVHDRPILQHVLSQRELEGFSVLNQSLQPEAYAFGLPTASPLREAINQSLLETIQEPAWQSTLSQYLGDE
ncbi:MAG: transporter substrate-binding domain-containing protein [Verrucomicrobia bacterium]|jgi:ABC-type amino acid transport substrate-binding protein|nr:transporter substrate-binding domain-containing protein [Verrucomicrobiota bacterium]